MGKRERLILSMPLIVAAVLPSYFLNHILMPVIIQKTLFIYIMLKGCTKGINYCLCQYIKFTYAQQITFRFIILKIKVTRSAYLL